MDKCKCGGQLVLTKNQGTSWGSNMEGNACCPEHWTAPGYVYCQTCKAVFHKSILGKFRLISKFPGYELMTGEEKCGNCWAFNGDNNRCDEGRSFRMYNNEACFLYQKK